MKRRKAKTRCFGCLVLLFEDTERESARDAVRVLRSSKAKRKEQVQEDNKACVHPILDHASTLGLLLLQ